MVYDERRRSIVRQSLPFRQDSVPDVGSLIQHGIGGTYDSSAKWDGGLIEASHWRTRESCGARGPEGAEERSTDDGFRTASATPSAHRAIQPDGRQGVSQVHLPAIRRSSFPRCRLTANAILT